MVTVRINEDTLLEMLLDRVEFWTSNEDEINLYRDYYKGLVFDGCLDDCVLDIKNIVDNDYVNYFTIINKKDFEQWNIESEEDNSIKAFNKEKDLYLIESY